MLWIKEFIFTNKQTYLVAKISAIIFIPNNVESELVIVSNTKLIYFSQYIKSYSNNKTIKGRGKEKEVLLS